MRVFLSEYITSGALVHEPLPPSLLREGLAMRNALAEDLLALPNVTVRMTCDPRLASVHGAESCVVASAGEEWRGFLRLCSECDAVLVIAPESDGVLLQRCEAAAKQGARLLNCTPEAVALCGDKLALARRLAAAGIPTLPTDRLEDGDAPRQYPLVIKPQDGAGSRLTFCCRDAVEFQARLRGFSSTSPPVVPIVQSFIAGRALSIAAVFHDTDPPILWPITDQHLSDDGTFQYLGGRLPAADADTAAVECLVRAAAALVPGLRGYVGFDVLLPFDTPRQPLLVEINPRLTTSYVGYRRLARSNLAQHLFETRRTTPDWRHVTIEYTADGRCTEHPVIRPIELCT